MQIDAYMTTYTEHHKAGAAIAAVLRSTGTPALMARADRIGTCGTYTTGYYCADCGEFHVVRARLCRDRLCPNCGWLLAKRRYHDTVDALKRLNGAVPLTVSHLVLTLQHDRDSDLRALLLALTRGYGRLMRNRDVSASVLGAARSVELTHGEEHGFHPHIHAIVCEPTNDAKLSTDTVARLWKRELNASYLPQVSLEPAYSKDGSNDWLDVAAEACKYAIKPGALAGLDADTLATAAAALRNVRMTASSGALKQALREREPAARPTACKACGSADAPRYMALAWDYAHDTLLPVNPI